MPEGIEQSKTARLASDRPIPSTGQDDHLVRPAPSPDQDDRLPIKKLKTQHSQWPDLHSQSSTQNLKPIPSTVNTRPSSSVNRQPLPTINTQPSPTVNT